MDRKKNRNNGQKRSTRHSGLPIRDHDGWRIRWIDADGKRRSKNFPTNAYKEAVAELTRIKGEIQAIKDGRMPRQQVVPTFDQFANQYWIPNRTRNKRSPKDDRSILKKHLLPAFGGMPLNHITTSKAEAFKGSLAESGLKSKTVNNILTLLISMLNYARELDFLYRLPQIKKPKSYRRDYAYLKTDGQIRAFLRTAKQGCFPRQVFSLSRDCLTRL